MNFGTIIKEEIISKAIKEKHCQKSFLSGIIRGTGTLYEKNGELGVEFAVTDEKIAFIVAEYLRNVFGYEIREITCAEDRLNKKNRFNLNICGNSACNILENLGVLTQSGDTISVSYDLFGVCEKRICCEKALLRGLFLSCGGCNVSTNGVGGYHLEMSFSHYVTAENVLEKLAFFGVNAKIMRRKENFVLYIKSAEEIKDFIALLPAPVSVLKMSDIMIEREISNKTNRQINCDIGNVSKQITASVRQIEAINKIDKTKGLDTLKADLYDVAMARKNNPDDTLTELSIRLGITKSCLNHRLRKIMSIAEKI